VLSAECPSDQKPLFSSSFCPSRFCEVSSVPLRCFSHPSPRVRRPGMAEGAFPRVPRVLASFGSCFVCECTHRFQFFFFPFFYLRPGEGRCSFFLSSALSCDVPRTGKVLNFWPSHGSKPFVFPSCLFFFSMMALRVRVVLVEIPNDFFFPPLSCSY